MRRDVLEAAGRRIVQDIHETNIAEMMAEGMAYYQRVTGPDREKPNWVKLEVITNLINRSSQYGDAERAILRILGVDELYSAASWQSQLGEASPEFVFTNYSKLRSVISFLPRILGLLEREYQTSDSKQPDAEDDMLVQTIILSDEGNSLSSPKRLIELLLSVQNLYNVIAKVESVPDTSLAVVGMDSGSEKSFDFLGIARLMHELRELLQSVYNMVAFHKQNVTLKNLQIAGETLTVVSKIAKLEQSNGITSEEAGRLRHTLYSNLEKFSATGAYTPEMAMPQQAPSLVMKAQPRLLTGPVDDLVRSAHSTDISADKLASSTTASERGAEENLPPFTATELAEAAKLLKQSRSTRSTVKKKSNEPRSKRARRT